MKRIISLICTLLLISSLSISALADEKTCIIMGEMDSLSYNGYTYYPIENTDFFVSYGDSDYLEYEFDNKKFEKKLDYVDIAVPKKSDYIIEAYITYGSVTETIYYVRSDKNKWMEEFLGGKNASYIITENSRAYVNRFLDYAKVEDWLSEENKVSVTSKKFRFYAYHSVYITDENKEVRFPVGYVYENGEDFFFVKNDDFSDLSVAYKLSDEAYIEEMKETYSEDATETVDEEIMQSDEKIEVILTGFTELSLIVMIVLFLVLIPLAAIVLSIIFLFVKHASPIYRVWLKAVIIAAAVVLICSVPIIIVLF